MEKPTLRFLNIIALRYEYPYLKCVTPRGEILFNLIKPNLEQGDKFLDIMCGYSPLAAPLLKSGYKITGFDDNRIAIRDLKKLYPSGNWVRASFSNFKNQSAESPFSVFLLLGAFELCCQESFISLIINLLNANKPRIFFLETNRSIEKAPTIAQPFVDDAAATRSVHLKGYNTMLELLTNHGYEIVDVGQYDAHLVQEWATIRIFAVLRAKTNLDSC